MEEERRAVNKVSDVPVEKGIMVGNILSGLILAAILWVGSTIISLKDDINDVIIEQKVIISELSSVKMTQIDHEKRLRSMEHEKRQ